MLSLVWHVRMNAVAQHRSPPLFSSSIIKIFGLALIIAALSEWLGPLPVDLGVGKVVLLPMIWALLIGLTLGLLAKRVPNAIKLSLADQHLAAAILSSALFLFIAKLGLLVGGSLPKLAEAGWALALQEVGNLIGCILLGMPVALLLGIKREAVGATFSIGREPGWPLSVNVSAWTHPKGGTYWPNTLLVRWLAPSSFRCWPAS